LRGHRIFCCLTNMGYLHTLLGWVMNYEIFNGYEYLNVITQMSHYAGLNEYLNYWYGIVYVPNATKRINSLY